MRRSLPGRRGRKVHSGKRRLRCGPRCSEGSSLVGSGACSAIGVDKGAVRRWLGSGGQRLEYTHLGVVPVFCRPMAAFLFPQAGK